MAIIPIREVVDTLDSGAQVRTVSLSDGSYGLQFTNAAQDVSRASFSKDAAIFLSRGLTALLAGGGEEVKREWRVVPPNEIVRSEKMNKKAEEHREEILAAACLAFDPVLFGDDAIEAHRRASPIKVDCAKERVMNQLLPVVDAIMKKL